MTLAPSTLFAVAPWSPDLVVACAQCGNPFNPDRANYRKGKGRFCSTSCSRLAQRGRLIADYSEDSPARKIRANGLINKRISLGLIVRPKNCQRCTRRCRTDAHHPDYSRPDLAAFLCRSCHNRLRGNRRIAADALRIALINRRQARRAA
ncbi:MAG: hypothetical protein H7Z14_01435 [Anaerolineae bacterium]|nr:hypothetical protein [Phycisphaerae bacterium]